jgi:hypothetical protein
VRGQRADAAVDAGADLRARGRDRHRRGWEGGESDRDLFSRVRRLPERAPGPRWVSRRVRISRPAHPRRLSSRASVRRRTSLPTRRATCGCPAARASTRRGTVAR